jgi:hypothetical protein
MSVTLESIQGRVNALHISQVFKNVIDQIQKNIDGSTKRFIFKGVIEKNLLIETLSILLTGLKKYT